MVQIATWTGSLLGRFERWVEYVECGIWRGTFEIKARVIGDSGRDPRPVAASTRYPSPAAVWRGAAPTS